MAKGCTGGETTTGVLKSEETVNFLRCVFEYKRAKTATKDNMFGDERNEGQGLRVRPQLLLLI